MKRYGYLTIKQWFTSKDRKPLIIRGARQIGKSYLVRDFAKTEDIHCVELNFERDPLLVDLFKTNDPKTILKNIENYKNTRIQPSQTLLFLDEIQVAPEVLAKLRWFYEELPSLAIIAAGSLLDFTLKDHVFSMPVGRISFLHLEPFSFGEFLLALGEEQLHTLLVEAPLTEFSSVIHTRFLDLFREYLLVGGMPAAIERYRSDRSHLACSEVQFDLLATLRDDFAKYATHVHHPRLTKVLQAVPAFLGGKWVYSKVDREERTETLKKALELLCLARVCHKIQATSATGLPLGATADERKFKVILLDVGLVSAALGLAPLASVDDFIWTNSGAIAEQVVGQLLRLIEPKFKEPQLYYWLREEKGSEAEVDYIIQHQTKIIPIEVKAGHTGSLRSLHLLMAEKKLERAVRLNSDLPSLSTLGMHLNSQKEANYQLLSLPMYLAEQLPRFLNGML